MRLAGSTIGTARFLDVDLEIAPGVLAPREETELLGRTVIDILRRHPEAQRVVDMCCGSGNLACAVANAVPGVTVWASDLTDACVAFTRRNVERLGLARRVVVCQGDLFASLESLDLAGRIDLVMCNPPYISTSRLEGDRSYLLEAEPREAFDGGPYGLSIHQRIIREALDFLRPGGWLAIEFGHGQEGQLASLFKRARGYESPVFITDAEGLPRVVTAQKPA
jgi:HemK-like putative methylase